MVICVCKIFILKVLVSKIFFLKELGPAFAAGPFVYFFTISSLANWVELNGKLAGFGFWIVSLCFCGGCWSVRYSARRMGA
jgi:hypothetical protein